MMSKISNNTKNIPGGIRSKHRLAEISHHFLSNENERSPAWKDTTIIPILLGSKHHDYIVYELNRAFNRHDDSQKSSSMVLNIENHITGSSTLSSAMEKYTPINSSDNNHEDSSMPDYCLVPVTSPPTTMALQSEKFIIAVHASLSGVRIAYDQLAFMASLETDFNVCVIILGAKNIREAKRFFGFLCDNAQSLLAIELECGGFLLQDDDDVSTASRAANSEFTDGDIPTDFDSVVSKMLQQFLPNIKTMTGAALSSPAGVAGLLS